MSDVLYRIEGEMHEAFPVISFSTNVYDNPADIFDSIERLAQYFQAVEFEIGEAAEEVFWQLDCEQRLALAAQIKAFTTQRGVTFTVHAGWWGRQYNLCSPDAEEQAQAIECLGAAVRFSLAAGATSVTFHPGYKDKYDNTTLLNCLITAINRLQEQVDCRGIALCLENMGGERPKYPVFSVEEHLRFHRETGCYITIDVTHLCSLYPYGNALFDAIARLAPVTRHLHIADLQGTHHQHLPLGEGNLPLSDVLNRFAAGGYRGVAVVEEFIPKYSTAFYLEKAREYQRRLESMRHVPA
ncbi:sugar phosphate isomerase/epimerase family protein [Serratia rubidaea]|uniref:sugar phosphate isomerase/epimerase family protein n=1 Tax=Serratia rubidaea TaxID=61652 RepID=UPI00242DCD0D|nr:sugar phosphate isomerase/epimerase family protein [Serratia rubidaea]MCR0996768.1 sugar phosphate isomerase/epimerase [Serratia rubidaea]